MSEFQASSLVHFHDAGEPEDTEAKENRLTDLLNVADNAFEHVKRHSGLKKGLEK